MKKLIRYRLPISMTFPATHSRAGEPTFFEERLLCSLFPKEIMVLSGRDMRWKKLHTIRGNYTLWKKRFEKINRGEAILELYKWSGKPYQSKTVIVFQLGKEDGIGLQKIVFPQHWPTIPEALCFSEKYSDEYSAFVKMETLAKNDGLHLVDFLEWFKKTDKSKAFALIHFTSFRY